MNKILPIVLVLVLTSCQQKKIDRIQVMADSISRVAIEKDSTITGFLSTMNEIQQNLDSIKYIEEFVKMETGNGTEMRKDARSTILDDIKLMHELLLKNKELVNGLQKNLNSSNYKIGGLQQTILYLNKQVQEKDGEILELKLKLEKLQLDISGLNMRILEAEKEGVRKDQLINQKNETIETQVSKLNTAYYVFGTLKELIENGVVEKDGGLLGIGRTVKFRKDFNPDVFTQVDIRVLSEINLNADKVKVITTHAASSFELQGDDKVEKLVINSPQEFWKTSKYLVIVVN